MAKIPMQHPTLLTTKYHQILEPCIKVSHHQNLLSCSSSQDNLLKITKVKIEKRQYTSLENDLFKTPMLVKVQLLN